MCLIFIQSKHYYGTIKLTLSFNKFTIAVWKSHISICPNLERTGDTGLLMKAESFRGDQTSVCSSSSAISYSEPCYMWDKAGKAVTAPCIRPLREDIRAGGTNPLLGVGEPFPGAMAPCALLCIEIWPTLQAPADKSGAIFPFQARMCRTREVLEEKPRLASCPYGGIFRHRRTCRPTNRDELSIKSAVFYMT